MLIIYYLNNITLKAKKKKTCKHKVKQLPKSFLFVKIITDKILIILKTSKLAVAG